MKVLILLVLTINLGVFSAQAGFAGNNTADNSSPSGLSGVNPHAISLYNLGLSAYKQGSPESAIIFFKRAVDLDPDLADAQYNLGVLYQSERRLKEAVPRFQEALRVKPDDADSHYQLGLALIDLNEMSQARQNLMAIAPNNGHFADAQKKIAFIDNQLSGAQTANQLPTNPAVSNPAVQTATVQPTATQNPAVAQNPAIQNAAVNPSPPTTATSTSMETAANNAAASMPNTGPIAVAANATLQTVANGFAAPSGIAFDRLGNLYIANFLSNTIDRISPDGNKTQFSSGINLKGPIGLIADDENSIYVANYLAGTVTKINAAGIAQIIASGLKKPYYLAMDKQGNLFISQQEDNSVIRITLSHDPTAKAE
jgi:tetratricopeptide (TPR) repeat protein